MFFSRLLCIKYIFNFLFLKSVYTFLVFLNTLPEKQTFSNSKIFINHVLKKNRSSHQKRSNLCDKLSSKCLYFIHLSHNFKVLLQKAKRLPIIFFFNKFCFQFYFYIIQFPQINIDRNKPKTRRSQKKNVYIVIDLFTFISFTSLCLSAEVASYDFLGNSIYIPLSVRQRASYVRRSG